MYIFEDEYKHSGSLIYINIHIFNLLICFPMYSDIKVPVYIRHYIQGDH